MATVGGSLAGIIVRSVNLCGQEMPPVTLYDDGLFWKEIDVEEAEDIESLKMGHVHKETILDIQ